MNSTVKENFILTETINLTEKDAKALILAVRDLMPRVPNLSYKEGFEDCKYNVELVISEYKPGGRKENKDIRCMIKQIRDIPHNSENHSEACKKGYEDCIESVMLVLENNLYHKYEVLEKHHSYIKKFKEMFDVDTAVAEEMLYRAIEVKERAERKINM